MQRNAAHLSASLLLLLNAASAQAAAPTLDQQWQCEAGPGGSWRCGLVARPQGPFPAPDRPYRPPSTRELAGVETPADILTNTLDWVPREQLAEDVAKCLPVQCSGAYVEPPLPVPAGETLIGTVQANSEHSEMQEDPQIARFSGNVTVSQDQRRLRADKGTYYREEDRLEIEGDVQYREPGLLVRGEKATVNTADKSGVLDNARFVMHKAHKRGTATRVVRNADGTLDFTDGTITQCAPDDNAWQLLGKTIHIDRETGRGTARDARVEVKDIPVAYTPYLSFPIDDRRLSGFLWPEFTNSPRNGFDLSLPYYLNLAPNYDATITPRYMDKRGPMASAEFRYKNTWSEWEVHGGYLPDDDVYGDSRWLTGLQHTGRLFEQRLYTMIDYTKASDEDFIRNLNTTGLAGQRDTHAPQHGYVAYSLPRNWNVYAQVLQYQLLDPALQEAYKMLPRLGLVRGFSGGDFEFDYAANIEYTAFDHQDPTLPTGQRLYMEPTITYPMQWSAGYIKPSAGWQVITYNLDRSARLGGPKSPSVAAPVFNIDSGLFFERESSVLGRNFVQTLEPRAYYLWVANEDHGDIPNFDSSELTFAFSQLFRPTRFSGHDRIGDANQASFSVTSRLIDDADGQELVTASVGQILYFANRRVNAQTCTDSRSASVATGLPRCSALEQTDSTSEMAAEIQLQPTRDLNVSSTALWDNGRAQVKEGGMLVHWTPDARTIVNAGYRYRRDQLFVDHFGTSFVQDIDQGDLSAVLPISDRWRLLARYQYDFTNKNNIEELGGLEYSSCCWSARVVYQEGIDWQQKRNYGFYLQFVLHGIGGFGKDIDQLLHKSIFGYGDQTEEFGVHN